MKKKANMLIVRKLERELEVKPMTVAELRELVGYSPQAIRGALVRDPRFTKHSRERVKECYGATDCIVWSLHSNG